jgi:hypothetical protein
VSSALAVGGYAFWRMGTEDPALWTVLRGRDALSGSVATALNDASRTVTYDPGTCIITAESIVPSLPTTSPGAGSAIATTTLSLTAPSACPYRSVTLTGMLSSLAGPVSGRSIVLQSSTDGLAWSESGVAVCSPDGFTFAATPTARTFYRVVFRGDSDYRSTGSAVVTVTPQVAIGSPKSSKPVKRGKRFTVAGSLSPSKVGRCAVLYVYRWQSRRWKLKTVLSGVAARGGYKATSRGLASGEWRIRARFVGDTHNSSTWSSARVLRVR